MITVGTASQEGIAAEEVARAERRAKQAATLISGAVDATTPIWTLNLGQYRDPCTNCETGGTSWQRPFIVIAVKETGPRHRHRRGADRRHERQGEAAEPVELLRLRPDTVPLSVTQGLNVILGLVPRTHYNAGSVRVLLCGPVASLPRWAFAESWVLGQVRG